MITDNATLLWQLKSKNEENNLEDFAQTR